MEEALVADEAVQEAMEVEAYGAGTDEMQTSPSAVQISPSRFLHPHPFTLPYSALLSPSSPTQPDLRPHPREPSAAALRLTQTLTLTAGA